jgi:hypothetical protein
MSETEFARAQRLLRENFRLEANLNVAIEALKFYANEEIYEQKEGTPWETPDGQLHRGFYTQISDHDYNGQKARDALKSIKETDLSAAGVKDE